MFQYYLDVTSDAVFIICSIFAVVILLQIRKYVKNTSESFDILFKKLRINRKKRR